MLACDLILEVRASRSITAEQVERLERLIIGGGGPTVDHLELLLMVDRYARRCDPSWPVLLDRARYAAAQLERRAA